MKCQYCGKPAKVKYGGEVLCYDDALAIFSGHIKDENRRHALELTVITKEYSLALERGLGEVDGSANKA